jgi:hypothetical protein
MVFLMLGQFLSFFKVNKLLRIQTTGTVQNYYGYVQIIRDPGCPKSTVLPGTLLVVNIEAKELRIYSKTYY